MSGPPIDTTFGAAFVALVISAVLYGLTLLQTYSYFGRFPRDPLHLKITVFVLWVLDTLHLVLCTTAIYWYLVRNFNNPGELAFNHWTINLQTDCNGVIGLIVELFFAQRVWKVSKNMYLTGIICVLAFLHCGLGIYFTVQSFILKEFMKYSELTWVTSVGLGGAAAADILIAVSLVYFLGKNRTGFEATDSLITTLMLYAINTGLLTSICASLAVICFAIMPTNFIWLSFFWCLGKLYVNSILASLNSRMQLRERISPSEGTFVNLTNLRNDGSLQSPGINRRFSRSSGMIKTPRQLTITVETTKEEISDYTADYKYDEEITPTTVFSPTSKASSAFSLNTGHVIELPSPDFVESGPSSPEAHRTRDSAC